MLSDEISQLASQGRYCFSFEDLNNRVDSSADALKAALRRLLKKGEVAMPLRGFYVIVPPEYRSLGCLPAEQFIPDLMAHLDEVYYAGLLTAAAYHGAAHHRPQVFQVVVAKPRRSIRCGKVKVDFVVRNNIQDMPTQVRNTPTGVLRYSTPESTAFDLVGYGKQCGGLDNVATVLAELSENLKAEKLSEIAKLSPIAWSQRLGYLLDILEAGQVSGPLALYVKQEMPVRTPLLPAAIIKGAKTDNRWKVFVNAEVEAEV
jgi:predicted transcriptional regulator of viral defense system